MGEDPAVEKEHTLKIVLMHNRTVTVSRVYILCHCNCSIIAALKVYCCLMSIDNCLSVYIMTVVLCKFGCIPFWLFLILEWNWPGSQCSYNIISNGARPDNLINL